MKIYLDYCCFNRPFDDHKQVRIRLEAESKLYIQKCILEGKYQLVWSYILDYENSVNPYQERQRVISIWKNHSVSDIEETEAVKKKANSLNKIGLRAKDSIHLACAIIAGCSYFLTTDDT